jgi:hypothetical protein
VVDHGLFVGVRRAAFVKKAGQFGQEFAGEEPDGADLVGQPVPCGQVPTDETVSIAECARIIGIVVLDHGRPPRPPIRTRRRHARKGHISVRQLEGDAPRVEVEWPDSTADFPEWRPHAEGTREIGRYMVEAAGLLDGGR